MAALAVIIIALKGILAPEVPVETATVSLVYPSQTLTALNASGYVVAQRKAALASKITGRLVWLGVEEGSRVHTGEVVARLEGEDAVAARQQALAGVATARAAREQALADLDDASRTLRREKELLAQGIVAQADYDAADARYLRGKAVLAQTEANIRGAQAALNGARIAVDYTMIRAPFDAVVLTKNADVGDIVTPLGAAANAKAAVVTIADSASLEIEADVSESNLGLVRPEQPCEIQLDALPDKRFRGIVHTIVPTADRSKATVLVKVRFLDRNPRILPEMSAKVAFLKRELTAAERQPRIAVASTAISTAGGKSLVFLVKGNRAVATPVTLGEKIGDYTEIRSGVAAGARVVTSPLERMKDGVRVTFAEK